MINTNCILHSNNAQYDNDKLRQQIQFQIETKYDYNYNWSI